MGSLTALVGGWPHSGTPGHDQGSPWADAEIQPVVTAYFTMLRAELAGEHALTEA
jgi:hypothetical protein